MSDGTESGNPPSSDGPWPRVDDVSQIYDHGQWWCANRAGHPDNNAGYPDATIHEPHDECRTLVVTIAGARENLSGGPTAFELYAAAPFRFGESRIRGTQDEEPRVMLEWYPDPAGDDTESVRISLALGDALLLARRVDHLVDGITTPPALTS